MEAWSFLVAGCKRVLMGLWVWVLRAAAPVVSVPWVGVGGGSSRLGGLDTLREEIGGGEVWALGPGSRFLPGRPRLSPSRSASVQAPPPAQALELWAWPVFSILASHLLCDPEQAACLLCAPVEGAEWGELLPALPVCLLLLVADVFEGHLVPAPFKRWLSASRVWALGWVGPRAPG